MSLQRHVVDPVCGMRIVAAEAGATRERDGKQFHFCSADCATRFDADADAYLAAFRAGEVVWPTDKEPDERGRDG